MNKAEFVKHISKELDISQTEMKKIVNTIFDNISDIIISGEHLSLYWFWTFSSVQINERKWSDPKNQKPIIIKALKRTKFKPSVNLKRDLNI